MDGKVRQTDKVIRSKQLISLSERKHQEFCTFNAGSEAEVLFENNRIGNLITGFTGNYIKVEYPWQSKMAGKIIKVRLLESGTDGNMTAELIEKI